MFGIKGGYDGGGARVLLTVQPWKLLNVTFPGIAKLDDSGSVALVDGIPWILSEYDLVERMKIGWGFLFT